jgi:hypothetical protein
VGGLGLSLALVLAGCGGSKTTPAAASTTSSSAAAVTSSAASAPAPSGSAAGGARNSAAFQKYTACLSQHGVTVPTFSGRPGGSGGPRVSGSARPFASGSGRPRFSGSARPRGSGGGFGFFGGASANPSTQAAMKACANLLPAGAVGFGGRAGGAISATTYASFKSCMSDNGVTLTGTTAQQGLASLNRSDAKTAAALKICQPILGTAGAASGSPAPAPSAS